MLEYLGILVLGVLSVLTAASILFLNRILGPRGKRSAAKEMPYECGIRPFAPPESPFTVKFYVTAMLFVVFDAALIFLYLWVLNFEELGLRGLVAAGVFTLSAALALGFAWKKGALEWK